MSHRQKIFIGLAVSAGFCTSLAVYFYIRRRNQRALSKTPASDRHAPSTSLLSSFKSRRGHQYDEITSSPQLGDENSETVRFQSEGATIELDIPGGGAPLSPEQATIFTRFLYESVNNDEQLHRALTSIANAATFKESQINLTNAGCLIRLRELLSITASETTKCKILLALNNLALNEFSIIQYSGFVSTVLDLCSTTPSGSPVRLCALKLLVNMCVLDYLHAEYMNCRGELAALIESTLKHDGEALETARIFVNLSTNKSNLENLLKMTNLDLKILVDAFTPSKKQINDTVTSKREDIFLRYITFFCNVAEMIVDELKSGDSNNNNSWLNAPTPQPEGALYFQLFDHDKQMSAKVLLRPQWPSPAVNAAIKRLRHAMDTIRQTQFETSVSSIHDEFNQNDLPTVTDTSTPKKSTTAAAMNNGDENPLDSLERDANEEFDDDDEDTTVGVEPSTSNQSLSSFRSAYSTNDNSNLISPEKTISV